MKIIGLYILCFLNISLSLAQSGRIDKSTLVDGVRREYILHIPKSYDGSKEVPLVFMLHGTGGDGEVMYVNSGWVELSEKEDFISVFPSSLRYRIDDGELKTITKWNTTPDAEYVFQPGEEGKDDIKFIKKVISEVIASYKINTSRIYLNGFSNGGSMAAKCSIELSDILAAVCSNAGSFLLDTIYVPKRKTPYLYQVGDRDYGPGNVGPEFPQIPMYFFDTLISNPNIPLMKGKHYRIANNCRRNFQLRSEHSIVGDSNFALVATYLPLNPNDNHEFKFIFVKNLGHSYPNWTPLEHWNWQKKYSLDTSSLKYTLTTNQGYGGGQFEKDKLLHIWAKQIDGKVFTHWSGDIEYLESPNEYHSVITMPEKNIIVTANYATLQPQMNLNTFIIRGVERLKTFFAFIPNDKNAIKGIVWFFHGTNGSAQNMVNDPDTRQMMNLLMVNNYGVIALTSEESEYNLDFNNDGYYRWSYGLDSTLIDAGNIRRIRDSLIGRGLIDPSTAHASIGWSAGGAFTEFISNILQWKAAINHTSSGSDMLSINPLIKVPYLVSINENDNNDGVGPVGNEKARSNVQNYINRGACARLHEQLESPLFPERFDRSDLISESLSRQIFNEIIDNNGLTNENYLEAPPKQLATAVMNNPAKFPVITSLTNFQKEAVIKQLEVTYADHSFKADINGLTLKFIEEACGSSSITQDKSQNNQINFWPNPTSGLIYIDREISFWELMDSFGKTLMKGSEQLIDVNRLNPGFYFLRVDGELKKLVKN